MEQPEFCPLEFYAIMNDCWEKNPNDRPLFSQLVDRIAQITANRSGEVNTLNSEFAAVTARVLCLIVIRRTAFMLFEKLLKTSSSSGVFLAIFVSVLLRD